uniref:Uncharacterized protein n=1 Tax=Marmota marmota marmota TaxID=9994 RepID=A0A8C5ZSU0_MARMA
MSSDSMEIILAAEQELPQPQAETRFGTECDISSRLPRLLESLSRNLRTSSLLLQRQVSTRVDEILTGYIYIVQ